MRDGSDITEDRHDGSGLLAPVLSAEMAVVMRRAAQAAECDLPVIVLGEPGTGKGVLAEFIHLRSARSGNKLVHLHCASLDPYLAQTVLFGHVRGAFTGS